jgi:hypothetical protein
MSLNKIIEEINQIKPILQEDITNGPRETYAGREGRQRNAREQMKSLKERYIDELRTSTAFILVCGSEKDKFSEIATNEFKCFTADPEGFYKDLANRIPQELYANRISAANLFDVMGRHLEDKAGEMQIIGYPQLIMKQQYQRALTSKEDFVSLIKEAINEQVGSEIAGIHVIRSIADAAIENNHSSRTTPIVLCTDDQNLALDLRNTLSRIGSKAFLVSAGKGAKTIKTSEDAFVIKEVEKESVENCLKNISNLCKTR